MKSQIFGLCALFALVTMSWAQISDKQLGARQFQGTLTLNAKPETVWGLITDAKKLFGLTGYAYKSGAEKFSKVGDIVQLKVWDDEGTLIVTKWDKNKELRLSWDPANASYICQERFLVAAKDGKTTLTYTNTYTESGAQSKEDIAAQVKALDELLQKIKAALKG